MVLDLLENKDIYLNMHSGFKLAFEFIDRCTRQNPTSGKYVLDGDKVYAMVQEYTTIPREQIQFEAHRKYIDIQFILCGSEIIEWTNMGDMLSNSSYNEEKDCLLCNTIDGTPLRLTQGSFAIFYPQDMHKPMCMIDIPSNVKKIIVKVSV